MFDKYKSSSEVRKELRNIIQRNSFKSERLIDKNESTNKTKFESDLANLQNKMLAKAYYSNPLGAVTLTLFDKILSSLVSVGETYSPTQTTSNQNIYWNESVQTLVGMWKAMYDASNENIIETDNGVFKISKTDTSLIMPKNSSEDNDVQISALLKADAGNYFGREQQISNVNENGQTAPQGYHFLTKPWVQPYFNKNGRSYKGIRSDDIQLNAISSSSNLNFTESQDSPVPYVRLLMPKNQRKVEVEDLNRNFWVIGTTIAALSSLIFPDKNGGYSGFLEKICDEIYHLWENVEYLWAYSIIKEKQDNKTYCEVVDLQNDFQPYRKGDNFEEMVVRFVQEAREFFNMPNDLEIFSNNFWTYRQGSATVYSKFLEFFSSFFDRFKNKYLDSNLAIIVRIRGGNYEGNHFSKAVYPGVFFYNRNGNRWIVGKFMKQNTPAIVIDAKELQKNTYGISLEEGKKIYVQNMGNALDEINYIKKVQLYNLLKEQSFFTFKVANETNNNITISNPNGPNNQRNCINYVDIVPEILGWSSNKILEYKLDNFSINLNTSENEFNIPYSLNKYTPSVDKSIESTSLYKGCDVGDLLSSQKSTIKVDPDIIFQHIDMCPFFPAGNYAYRVNKKVDYIEGEKLKFNNLNSNDTKNMITKWGGELAAIFKQFVEKKIHDKEANETDTFIGIGNHLINPQMNSSGTLLKFYYSDKNNLGVYDYNSSDSIAVSTKNNYTNYPSHTKFVNSNGVSIGLGIYLGACGKKYLTIPNFFFRTDYFEFTKLYYNNQSPKILDTNEVFYVPYQSGPPVTGSGLFNYKVNVFSEDGESTLSKNWMIKLQLVAGFGWYDTSFNYTDDQFINLGLVPFTSSYSVGSHHIDAGIVIGISNIQIWGTGGTINGYKQEFYQRPRYPYNNGNSTFQQIGDWTKEISLQYSSSKGMSKRPSFGNWKEVKVINNQRGPFFTHNRLAENIGVNNINFKNYPNNGCIGATFV